MEPLEGKGVIGILTLMFADEGLNLWKAQNQVNHLRDKKQTTQHDGCAVCAFTDNAVWSAAQRKGLLTAVHFFQPGT
jgi:hypothetical protein